MAILECCADSALSALAAERGGADRLELCQDLLIGGTTPPLSLYHQVRKQIRLPIHVLLRPRFGDFLYNDYELSQLEEDVRTFIEEGADGIVIGALTADGDLDMAALARLIDAAYSAHPATHSANQKIHITLHRAFDVCRDPFLALSQAKALGIQTILTSGQKKTALEGLSLLKELQEKAGSELTIMAGSGIDDAAIRQIASETSIRTFHLSGKESVPSKMRYRKEGVPMGISLGESTISEFIHFRTSEEKIRKAKATAESI
ncbi:MAG: copper homeostasis protein CutC [Firmicutes bacterium]|nr:copper homeostasis protein CutC [Bacillota bacterium]